jgi:hypothetical protein
MLLEARSRELERQVVAIVNYHFDAFLPGGVQIGLLLFRVDLPARNLRLLQILFDTGLNACLFA